LSSSRIENTVVITAEFHLKPAASDRAFTKLVQKIVHIKGEADMLGGKSRIHDLAAALRAYAQEKGQFPRGTADRRSTTDRAGLPFRPDQRVSWMAELLPYLGQGEFAGLKRHVDDQQSWRVPSAKDNKEDLEGKNNRFVCQTLIPYFLASDSPPTAWWVNYPGMDYPVASTHFVGIAGIGLDAAGYSATDPAVAKKLGIFGYDRATKLEDVKDGLDKTIVLLQVPTDVKTCWLAGGGSTIRGVPEIDPVQPFVCTIYNGKQGTFAIMGDGKVRFISKDINPEVFKGMCTINGGEAIDDLDQIAPVVPGGEAVLKPEVPGAKPPVDNTPKPPVGDTPKPPVGSREPPTADEQQSPPSGKVPMGWQAYSPKGGGFTVHLPAGKIEESTIQIKTGAFETTARQGLVELAERKNARFSASYFDLPKEVSNKDAKAIFDSYLGSLARGSSSVDANNDATWNGRPLRIINLTLGDGSRLFCQLVLEDNRIFERRIVAVPGEVTDAERFSFMDSFDTWKAWSKRGK
jgi:hypothetical protein